MDSQKSLIFIVGPSGRGKSTSIRNLDPAKTAILDAERKPFPFREQEKFANRALLDVKNPELFITFIRKLKDRPQIETIVFDSFSAWAEALVMKSRLTKTGYDVWNYYNDTISQLFQALLDSKKVCFLMAHDEFVSDTENYKVRRIKVKGKENEGMMERFALLVLFATFKKDEEEELEYVFETRSDGVTSAKTPMGMFEERYIPNDLNLVLESYKKYYQPVVKNK